MSHDEILNLTVPQMVAELEEGKGSRRTREQIERLTAGRRDEMFRGICAADGLSPEQLAALPADQLAARVKAAVGGRGVVEANLPRWAAEFAARESDAK